MRLTFSSFHGLRMQNSTPVSIRPERIKAILSRINGFSVYANALPALGRVAGAHEGEFSPPAATA